MALPWISLISSFFILLLLLALLGAIYLIKKTKKELKTQQEKHDHEIARLKSIFVDRESELIESERRVNEALKFTKVGIWEWNIDKDIWFATPSYFTMLGYPPITGNADREIELEKVHPEDRENVLSTIKSILNNEAGTNYYKYEARVRHINGEYKWVGVRCIVTEHNEQDKPSCLLGVRIEIDEIKKAHKKVEWFAHHDSLTKLPNRFALNKTFNQIAQNNTPLALLFIDLDRFKNINDSLGHTIGDKLLSSVAERIRSLISNTDYIARQGGDEFIILLPTENKDTLIQKVIEIKESLSERYKIEKHEFFITISVGISLYPSNGKDFETLFKKADLAMYHAKSSGRNGYSMFTQEMQALSTRAHVLENAFQDAIKNNEFSLHYQPQVSLSSGLITGAEALIRWHSKELGKVSPDEFIPLAEDSGQILAIGEWVIHEAARQLKEWLEKGLPPIRVAVNLSYAQFQVDNLPAKILKILKKYNLPASSLELELTERIAIRDPDKTIKVLETLQRIGIQTAIDDFGTGYSSLSYLQRFPIYRLKIDQSFVRNMTTNENDHVIIKAIISLAQQLGMVTIAEGVETKEQLHALKSIGCDDIQGYYIGHPMPHAEFEDYLLNSANRLKCSGQ